MTDNISKKHRSWNMSRIKSGDTKPELIVRSMLHHMGYRFRLHRKDLPGKPDIVLPRHKTAIFVHGCFWHRHKGCNRATTPKTNQNYWHNKFSRNIIKHSRDKKELAKSGWNVVVIWECKIKNKDILRKYLNNVLLKG